MRRSRSTITLVTPPVKEPVTVSEAKIWARLDDSSDDATVTQLLAAVRATAEEYLRRALLTQTYKLTLDLACSGLNLDEGTYDLPVTALYGGLPQSIELPKGPIQSISSVATYDLSNATTAFASSNYFLDAAGERLVLNYGAIWPSNLRPIAAVEITFVAGYGDAPSSVPQPIKSGMMIHLASLYEQRGECDDAMGIPPGAKRLYDQYRIMGDRLG